MSFLQPPDYLVAAGSAGSSGNTSPPACAGSAAVLTGVPTPKFTPGAAGLGLTAATGCATWVTFAQRVARANGNSHALLGDMEIAQA